MTWKQIEATPLHLGEIVISGFLVTFALFSVFIRNRLHLAEPPLALLTGVIFGPHGAGILNAQQWGAQDNIVQEFTRLIVGLQVFAVGIELPTGYFRNHWRSILWLLGPVMTFGWIVCALLIWWLFDTSIPTALTISACLTPTDPVLSASVISNSRFSARVPKRIKHLLSCESGCNDGVSFPFLFVGLSILCKITLAGTMKQWFLITLLYQCCLGIAVGIVIGLIANRVLRFSDTHRLIGPASFLVFYLLLAVLSVGVAATLGLDDFLVAFSAGIGFAHDGWFAKRTKESKLNVILDLVINSTFFVYFGTIMPWHQFQAGSLTPSISLGKLVALLALILLLRRIPAVLVLKNWIPDIKTYGEALFVGHFGPMGVGAIFLAVEARAHLETDTSEPLPVPDPSDPNIRPIKLIWPIVCFIVFGSTLVHGFSVAATSVLLHFKRGKVNRAQVIGAEADPLEGMVHEESQSEESDEEEDDDEDDGWTERNSRIVLPGG